MFKRKNRNDDSNLPEDLIKLKANQIKQNKCRKGIAIWQQNHEINLLEAKNYLKAHPLEVLRWRLNQRLIFLEKECLEPLDDWINGRDVFESAVLTDDESA